MICARITQYQRMHSKDVRISRGRKILAISDIHVPYHDKRALAEALKAGRKQGCNTVIILGDLCDFHKVSKYRHDATALEIEEELKIAREVLQEICVGYSQKYFVPGNHEDRLHSYILDNAPSLKGLEELSLDKLLQLEQYGIQYVPGGFIHCGDMTFLHGHEVRISGMDPARKLFTKMKKSAICGHLHRPDSYYTRDGAGSLLQCHVLGHLGERSPAFMPRNDWQHGCAVISVPKQGKSHVQTYIL